MILNSVSGIMGEDQFGKNTIAGALNITTANPTDDFEGYVSALYEVEQEETILESVFSGPLTDTLSARLALRWSEMNDGWIYNQWRKKGEPTSKTKMGRLSLSWEPNDKLNVLTKITFNKFDQQGRNSELTDANGKYPGAPFVGNMAALLAPFGETGQLDGIRTVGGTSGTLFDRDESNNNLKAFAVTANYKMGNHLLTSVTGYTKYDMFDAQDNDVTPLDILAMQADETYKQFSQEIRLTSPGDEVLDYVIGAYYQNDKLDTTQYVNVNLLDIVVVPGVGPAGPPLFSGRWANMDQETDSWAVFTQLTWNITDAFRTTLGLRYSKDKKDVTHELRLTEFGNPNSPLATLLPPASGIAPGFAQVAIWGGFPLNAHEHLINSGRVDKKLTPTVNVQWDINSDVMLYASASTGYKGGGFDAYYGRAAGTFNYSPPFFEFEDEDVTAFELGTKLSLLSGAAELNFAIFRNDFKDVQVSTFDGGLSLRVSNAAKTVSQGIEVDGRWAITQNLIVSGALAYVDAYYKKFENAQCYFGQSSAECTLDPTTGLSSQDMSGNELQFSPNWSGHLAIEHVQPLGALKLSTTLDVDYSGSYYSTADLDPRSKQDAFTKVDLRVALGNGNGTWNIAFIGRNLTDETTSTWANDTALANGGFYSQIDRARSYAIQVRYVF